MRPLLLVLRLSCSRQVWRTPAEPCRLEALGVRAATACGMDHTRGAWAHEAVACARCRIDNVLMEFSPGVYDKAQRWADYPDWPRMLT